MRSTAVLALVGCVLTAGCREAPPTELEALERPSVERLEEAVRRQFDEAHERLDSPTRSASATDSAAAWGELGMLYDVYGFPVAAVTCYRNAATLDPGRFEWHYYRARLARGRGALEEAGRALARALELRPEDPSARVELARLQLDEGRLEEAGETLGEVLAADPGSPAALLARAELARQLEDWAAAAADYERLLALQPRATRLHRPLAIAYRELGDEERAKVHLARRGNASIIAEDPWLRALEALRTGVKHDLDEAEAAYLRGEFAAAEKAFAAALERDPDNARAHLGRGTALKALGRLDEALAEYETALELRPGYSKALYNKGVVLAQTGDDEAAVVVYDAALAVDPTSTDVRFNRANALRRLGRTAEAAAAYDELIADDPGNGSAHLGRAATLIEAGRHGDAVAALEESARLFPRSSTFENALARLLATSDDPSVRDPDRALELARGLATARSTVEHLETLAMAQAASGDFDAAVTTLDATLEALRKVLDGGGGEAAAEVAARVERARDAYRAGEPPSEPGLS